MMSKLQSNYSQNSLLIVGLIFCIALLLLLIGSVYSKNFTVIQTSIIHCKIAQPHFGLSWIHSVDKTPWLEYYERQDQGFLLTETKFKTFGAGVPHDGEVLESQDSMIHYRMNQMIPEINWIIDKDVSSTIIVPDNRLWKIYNNHERFSEVQIRNQLLNFWQRLLIRNCHES